MLPERRRVDARLRSTQGSSTRHAERSSLQPDAVYGTFGVMTLTTAERPLSASEEAAEPARRDVTTQPRRKKAAQRPAERAWTPPTVRWDRVVGVLALIGTFVLIALSMFPPEPTVLSPQSGQSTAPSSILGPSDAADSGTAGGDQ